MPVAPLATRIGRRSAARRDLDAISNRVARSVLRCVCRRRPCGCQKSRQPSSAHRRQGAASSRRHAATGSRLPRLISPFHEESEVSPRICHEGDLLRDANETCPRFPVAGRARRQRQAIAGLADEIQGFSLRCRSRTTLAGRPSRQKTTRTHPRRGGEGTVMPANSRRRPAGRLAANFS